MSGPPVPIDAQPYSGLQTSPAHHVVGAVGQVQAVLRQAHGLGGGQAGRGQQPDSRVGGGGATAAATPPTATAENIGCCLVVEVQLLVGDGLPQDSQGLLPHRGCGGHTHTHTHKPSSQSQQVVLFDFRRR